MLRPFELSVLARASVPARSAARARLAGPLKGRDPRRAGRTAKDPVHLRRAVVVLASARGQTAKDVTVRVQPARTSRQ